MFSLVSQLDQDSPWVKTWSQAEYVLGSKNKAHYRLLHLSRTRLISTKGDAGGDHNMLSDLP